MIMDADQMTQHLLDIHRLMSEEMRHTSTVIWQFSIAVVTLQGGAVGLSGQQTSNSVSGQSILAVGFALSLIFSLFLVRQARERQGFKNRIQAVETELRKTFPAFYNEIPTSLPWLKSGVFAWILTLESAVGFLWVLKLNGVFKCG